MTDLLLFCLFLGDAVLVAAAAWFGVVAARLERRGLVEPVLAFGLLALSWVAASGVLLGLTGVLGRGGFGLLHAAGLALLLLWRRKTWHADLDSGVNLLRAWRDTLRRREPGSGAAVAVLLLLLGLAVLTARAEPMVYDALTYRLSRIGAWLQSGRVTHLATDDFRLNYMPSAPDLVIAWLLSATDEGYRLAALSQVAGGALLLGATFGLARLLGLNRRAAAGAVVLVLGMANVGVQFTTLHSDLFTAGVFAASYVLWHRGWLRGEGSWVAGVGIGLAFGAKGTMFYLAPGAALWAGWLVWRRWAGWRAWAGTAGGALTGVILFLAPDFARNLADYGGVFGPREAVVMHHGGPLTWAQHAEKLGLNLATSAVQLFEPHSQPRWLAPAASAAGRMLCPALRADDDPYVFESWSRRAQVEVVFAQTEVDADVVGCGLLAAGLTVIAGTMAVFRARRDGAAAQVLVWAGGVGWFVLTQHALVQWHQWQFRFLVLAAPWMAATGAWLLMGLPRWLRVAAWLGLGVSAVQVFVFVQGEAHQAAWAATFRPERARSHYLFTQWRDWAGRLDGPDGLLRVALPIDRPLAAFFRTETARPVRMEFLSRLDAATAEIAVAGRSGWLVVPLTRFKGREGRVQASTWLFAGDDASPNSVAAFRALLPGEEPWPILYRFRQSVTPGGLRRDLVVKTWRSEVALMLRNPTPDAWSFTAQSQLGRQEGLLQPGGERRIVLPAVHEALNGVRLDFRSERTGARAGYPVTLVVPSVQGSNTTGP